MSTATGTHTAYTLRVATMTTGQVVSEYHAVLNAQYNRANRDQMDTVCDELERRAAAGDITAAHFLDA